MGFFSLLPPTRAGEVRHKVPEGFRIEQVAGHPAIQFPMFACFDDRGRLFVAESSGLDLYAELVAQTRKCRISLLEDTDGDGTFDKARVFADKLVFPMGLAWREGKLYVADPPDLVVYEDEDDDGRADSRKVILSGFGHTDNGSLHGLIFGPDNLLYMTMGQPDGYKLKKGDGSVVEGYTGALIRCRPDGSNPEVLCRGFENLVEIAFLPGGQIIGTDNWFYYPSGGVRDALVHLVEGGLYPRHEDKGSHQVITGDPLPPVALFPAVALSGLARYEGRAFAGMHGQLFSAQHNTRMVGRHVLKPVGATYSAESFDFVTSEDPDFHPSDVLEDADGSLLVVDTGGWYVQHCPTGKIRDSKAPGGIFRVRRTAAKNVEDPWGVNIDWNVATAGESVGMLADARPVVRGKAKAALERIGDAAVPHLLPLVVRGAAATPVAQEQAVWALANINDGAAARKALKNPATDDVFKAACAAVALRRDRSAAADLERRLAGSADVQLAAAQALVHCGRAESVPMLVEALKETVEPFVRHALVHALYALADGATLQRLLAHDHAAVQQAAMVLLDQPPHRKLTAGEVVARLGSENAPLRAAAQKILAKHPEWAEEAFVYLRARAKGPALGEEEEERLAESLVPFRGDARVVKLVAEVVGDEGAAMARRRSALHAMTRMGRPGELGVWVEALKRAMGVDGLRVDAVRVVQVLQIGELDESLTRIVADQAVPREVRIEALRALVTRRPKVDGAAIDLLLGTFKEGASPTVRLAAGEVVARAQVPGERLGEVLKALWRDPLMTQDLLLPMIARSVDRQSYPVVAEYLNEGARKGWRVERSKLEELHAALRRLDASGADWLVDTLSTADDSRQERLAALEPLLRGGDAARGRSVFFGGKVACSTCHRVGEEGGLVGPDLTKVGAVRSGRDLIESIVFPSSTFAQGFENYVVTTKRREQFVGVIAERTEESFVLRDSSGAEVRIAQDQVAKMRRDSSSIMPEGLDRALTEEELRDLLAYLQALR